ncbi:MAG: hypothetical protein LN414_03545, partial [Candidatus Thermoplasmatota archaeon]|nr:hypothetical protein [Candidatus Thermoplasmatota archaeon]
NAFMDYQEVVEFLTWSPEGAPGRVDFRMKMIDADFYFVIRIREVIINATVYEADAEGELVDYFEYPANGNYSLTVELAPLKSGVYIFYPENEEGRFEWTIMGDMVSEPMTGSNWWRDVDLILMIAVTVIAVTAIIAVVVIVYLRQGDRMKRMPE